MSIMNIQNFLNLYTAFKAGTTNIIYFIKYKSRGKSRYFYSNNDKLISIMHIRAAGLKDDRQLY